MQQRLFPLAPEVLIFQAIYVHGRGWELTTRMRRDSEPWSDAYDARYSGLSSSELADVISAEALSQLGIS